MDAKPGLGKHMRGWRRLWRDARGATAIEYGLIISLVVIVMFAALADVGHTTSGLWNNFSAAVVNAH
jgi:pilus assembly protein Flp/PilA